MPYPDASFDRVLTVNTIYFWEQPQADLAEIRRSLKPGGRFVLVCRGLEGAEGGLAIHSMPKPTTVDDVADWMRQAGFSNVESRTRQAPFGPETVTAVAMVGTAA